VLGTRITLPPQDDPFRWNVAMVEPVTSQESAAPAAPAPPSPPVESPSQPSQQAPPPKPAVQQTTKPMPIEHRVETAMQPVVHQIETKPQEPRIERTAQAVETVQPMERTPEVRLSAVEAPPIVAPQAETAPAIIERPTQVAESSPAPTERVVEAPHVQPTGEAVQRAEVSHQPAPVADNASPVVAERATSQPIEQAAGPAMQPSLDAAPVVHNHETPSNPSRSAESATNENHAVQEERTVVAKTAPTTTPRPRADYGWVRDALWRRIVEMKHYPAQARLNHLEGKVILRAVIRSDGHLGDLSVKESSGHRLLDEAAMDVIRRICPVPMKHALGRPEVVVMIPIDYRLE
ncbi:MAG: TonB family protein, partial [Nitrospirales bacterium]